MGLSIQRPVRLIILLFLAFWILTSTAAALMAAEGDGSGGGQSEPLGLLSSYPADGQRDVQLPVTIKLTFSKNVINMTIKENNLKCFTLCSPDGGSVPIDVVLADDQMEPEKKREIILKPMRGLLPGTTYTVKVAPGLKAKNGAVLGKDLSLDFTTADVVKTKEENKYEMPPNKPGGTGDNEAPVVPKSAETKVQNQESGNKDTIKENTDGIPVSAAGDAATAVGPPTPEEPAGRIFNGWFLMAVGVIIIAALGLVYMKMRR